MPESEKISIQTLIDQMGTAQRKNRLKAAEYIIEHPEYFKDLLDLVFKVKYKYHYKAAWILEFVLEKNLNWLFPHLDFFTKNLYLLKNDSAIRPIAKICQCLATAYMKQKKLIYIHHLEHKYIERIVETGFDWMIGNYKIASQVYTMDTLYYFGCIPLENYEWIHPALKNIILQNSASKSAGYQTHGKKILKLI